MNGDTENTKPESIILHPEFIPSTEKFFTAHLIFTKKVTKIIWKFLIVAWLVTIAINIAMAFVYFSPNEKWLEVMIKTILDAIPFIIGILAIEIRITKEIHE